MNRAKIIRRKLRRPFETSGFLLLKFTIPLLPRRSVIALSRTAGSLAMLLPLRERTVGMKNIEAVFGDSKTDSEKRRILRSSFATFSLTMLDVFWFARNPEKRISKYVRFEESAAKTSLFNPDKAAICITAHIGSWELLGQACALMNLDLASIAATVKNQAVDRLLIEQRERTGQTIIPQKGALRTLITRFRNNGKAAFVLDQNTPLTEGGIEVEFLGFPMPVSSAPASLAYRTSTKIAFGVCLPEPDGCYTIRVTQTISPPPFDKEADAGQIAKELTQRIQDIISAEIRKHPEFWLWSYKHWRRAPGQSYPDHYPQY
ncbi:MAG: lysophospholipid acyltransferase family protein [Pontiellaceae bacterium]|nr:lysophospholipid acyltransferase family protein [Pontiellaceae bacterium]